MLQQHHNFHDNCVSNWQLAEANSIATGSVANVLLSFTGPSLQILTKYCRHSAGKCWAQELRLQLGSFAEGSSVNYFVSPACLRTSVGPVSIVWFFFSYVGN